MYIRRSIMAGSWFYTFKVRDIALVLPFESVVYRSDLLVYIESHFVVVCFRTYYFKSKYSGVSFLVRVWFGSGSLAVW